MTIKIPSIPTIPGNIGTARAALSAIKQVLDIREGKGPSDERFVRYGELQDLVLNTVSDNTTATVISSTDPPDPPSNFSIARSTFISVLTWDYPSDSDDVSHIEVLYNTSDDYSTSDTLAIVTKPTDRYVHSLDSLQTDYYYWIRCVNYAGDNSTFIPTGGGYFMQGDTSVDETISDVMTLLTEGGSSEPDELPFVSGNIDGTPTVGLNGNLIIDGSIITRNIQAGAIETDKLAANAVTAAKILAGEITLNKLNPIAGTVTFTSGAMTFANGADLELQSTADNTAMVTFTRVGYGSYSMYAGTGNLSIEPDQTGSQLVFGDTTNTDEIDIIALDEITLNCYGGGGTRLDLYQAYGRIFANNGATTSNYRFDVGAMYSEDDDDLGESGNPWGTAYIENIDCDHIGINSAPASTRGLVIHAEDTTASNYCIVVRDSTNTENFLTVSNSGVVAVCSLIPWSTGTKKLGLASATWAEVHADEVIIGGNAHANSPFTTTGSTDADTERALVTYNSSGTAKMSVSNTGSGYFTSYVSCDWLTERSGREFKKDIKNVDEVVLGKILKTNPIYYKSVDDEEAPESIGFLAESVKPIFPHIVHNIFRDTNATTKDALGIRYTGFIPYIIKGQHEQQEYIDSLADRVETLEAAQAAKSKLN